MNKIARDLSVPIRPPVDKETATLISCTKALEGLTAEERRRVIAYLAARFSNQSEVKACDCTTGESCKTCDPENNRSLF